MSSKLAQWQARNKMIRYLRSTVAILSYAYYVRGHSLISDERWQKMADDLHEYHSDEYDKYWKDWEPSTGFTLTVIPGLAHEVNKIMGTY